MNVQHSLLDTVRLRLLTRAQLTDPSINLYDVFIKMTTIRGTIETIR